MNHSSNANPLFRSFQLGGMTLASRIVMAPMTRQFSPEGVPGENVARYYRARAENAVGLIVTEGTIVEHADASNQANVPHFYGAAALQGWAHVVREVHEAGGRIMPQIWHMGARGDVNGYSEAEIAEIVQAFADAAAAARRLGFDGIELHGAHGYLIDQFLWERTNSRTDRYGGDRAARTRFAVEVVEACRAAVGPDFPIMLRLSQWKGVDFEARLAETPEQWAEIVNPLVEAGVDVFHCSTRRYWQPEFADADAELNLAGWTKKLTGKPVVTVGSVGLDGDVSRFFREGQGAANTGVDEIVKRLEREEFDLVAVGRALLADPAWARKLRDGRTTEWEPFAREALQTLR
ncbi:NADH:flavin oxidoreductase [Paenibacillus sp. IB182496]|uniref:NADH:flavin oxidoreductase n=1 Tax=Paenibacillus sabuli TaxID=2772509 RepID=A0A927BP12_9BACL|nr:NADH:flavin oxidoreductase [Paenibacillus sabuli]MBD2843622.1 NADH:flavin oxidoreductase [Paenibacillus sabuli]